MNINDYFNSPQPADTKNWQVGANLSQDLLPNSIALIFCNEYRGAAMHNEHFDSQQLREAFYNLGEFANPCQIIDLGDMRLGRFPVDSHVALSEILTYCFQKQVLPIVIGGSQDLSYFMIKALAQYNHKINYANISPILNLEEDDEVIDHKNYLYKILSDLDLKVAKYSHFGFQQHLNSLKDLAMAHNAGATVSRLADMTQNTNDIEPYFRHAHAMSLNADALESKHGILSVRPQVNGLNHREICQYAKLIGLSPYLQCFGFFNIALNRLNQCNTQLMAQILWYFIDGVSIRLSHPSAQNTETFVVMLDDEHYTFQRDIFKNQWYFGEDDDLAQCLPCSQQDYLMAKKGDWSVRLQKHLKN